MEIKNKDLQNALINRKGKGEIMFDSFPGKDCYEIFINSGMGIIRPLKYYREDEFKNDIDCLNKINDTNSGPDFKELWFLLKASFIVLSVKNDNASKSYKALVDIMNKFEKKYN